MMDAGEDQQGVKSGGDVIEHDPGASVQAFKLARRRRFVDVEKPEKGERQQRVQRVSRAEDERGELPGYLVDHHKLGIFPDHSSFLVAVRLLVFTQAFEHFGIEDR